MAPTVKNLPAVQETQVRSLGQKDPLEENQEVPGPTLEASQSESLHTPRTEGTLFIVVSFPKQRVCNPGNTP